MKARSFIISFIAVLAVVSMLTTGAKADPFTSWTSTSTANWTIDKLSDSIYENRSTGTGGTKAVAWSSVRINLVDFDVRLRIDRNNVTSTTTTGLAVVVSNTKDFCINDVQADSFGFLWNGANQVIVTRGSDCSAISTNSGYTQTFLYQRITRTGGQYNFYVSTDGLTWIILGTVSGNVVQQFPYFGSFSDNSPEGYRGSNFTNTAEGVLPPPVIFGTTFLFFVLLLWVLCLTIGFLRYGPLLFVAPFFGISLAVNSWFQFGEIFVSLTLVAVNLILLAYAISDFMEDRKVRS